MQFVLVNGRSPRPESSCALCCEPIGESYLRELTTRLPYCNYECYLGYCKLLALVALSRAAHAGPRITDKDYWLNELHASSQSTTRQTAPDRYGARAMVPGVGRAQIVPEGTSGQYENPYGYQGGPFPFW